MILFWLLPLVAALHIVEEFIFPGGFRVWYQHYRPSIAPSLTTRFLITVNSILIVVGLIPILIGMTPQGIALWLTVTAVLFSNSLFHIAALFKSQRYNPGVTTSVFLYLPLSLLGYWFFLSTRQASIGTASVSFILGSSYQWWSLYNHTRRSKSPRRAGQLREKRPL